MKTQVSPVVIGIAAVVLVAFVGFLGFKFLSPSKPPTAMGTPFAGPPPSNTMTSGDAYRQRYGNGIHMSSQPAQSSPYGGGQSYGASGQYRPSGTPR
jgi:cell division protein FtsN